MTNILTALTAILCGLSQLVLAVPAAKSSSTTSSKSSSASAAATAVNYCPYGYKQTAINQTASYDDIATTPVLAPPVPVPYRYLYHQAFVAGLVTPNPPPSGLIPHDGNNYAVTGLNNQQTQGTPMLSVNYPMSNVSAFDLFSFFFGCKTFAASTAAPLPCTVTITGYTGSDNTVASSHMVAAQTVQYNPTTLTGAQQLAYFEVSSLFRGEGVRFVTFQYTVNNTPVLQSGTSLVIDTVKYTVYNCSSS